MPRNPAFPLPPQQHRWKKGCVRNPRRKMTALVVVLVVVLIGFAIYKKDSVRASLKIYRIGFSLEAKDNPRGDKRLD
jgi:hypothetical protein